MMRCFKSSEAKTPSSLKCASTDITACGENDKPDAKYHSDDETTMCAFKAGVEACHVSKQFNIVFIIQLIFYGLFWM